MGVVCRGDHPGHGEKPVHLAFEALIGHVDAGLHEALGVGFAFVLQRIESGGDYIGGRQARMVLSAQGTELLVEHQSILL